MSSKSLYDTCKTESKALKHIPECVLDIKRKNRIIYVQLKQLLGTRYQIDFEGLYVLSP